MKSKSKVTGRPSKFSEDVFAEIERRISNGETMRSICREPGMPHWNTVYDWLRADTVLSGRIARARDLGFDAIAEDTVEIADDGRNDWMEKHGKDGESAGYTLNGDHVQRSKLRIETRLKLLAKWSPKKYGERTAIVGDDTADPVRVEVSKTQAARNIAFALALGIKEASKGKE